MSPFEARKYGLAPNLVPTMTTSSFFKSSCALYHSWKNWLPSSLLPADFCWPRHSQYCISDSGWLITRPGEAPAQRRDLPAKLCDNNMLHISHLFLRLCVESRNACKWWAPKPLRSLPNSSFWKTLRITQLFARRCAESCCKCFVSGSGWGYPAIAQTWRMADRTDRRRTAPAFAVSKGRLLLAAVGRW